MRFNIYIIDDTPAKTKALNRFIEWLKHSFPLSDFQPGFAEPNSASSDCEQIMSALSDPFGIVLLDAMMDGAKHIAASETLRTTGDIHEEEFATVWQFLHNHEGTKLAAAIVCIAKKLHSRILWISNQRIDDNLKDELGEFYENIPWFRLDDRGAWQDHHKGRVERLLSDFHPDARLNEAIIFALSPPPPSSYWEHDLLQSIYGHPAAPGPHNAALVNWIGDDVDEESAKALLCGSFHSLPWKVKSGPSRIVQAKVFRAVCQKCGLSISTQDVEVLLFPVQPSLPFLLALCVLVRQMEMDEDYHPPTQITLNRAGERFQLRLELNPQAKKGDAVVDMNLFEAAYTKALTDNVDGHNLTSRRLVDLTKAKVTLKYQISGAKSAFVNGTDYAASEVSFDKTQPAILISWPL